MFPKFIITLISVSISLSASLSFAAEKMPKRPVNPSPAQCLDLAIKTAKAIDAVADRSDSNDNLDVKSEVEYIDANMKYGQFLIYNFGDGESYLEVKYEANRYETGDCSLQSATIVYQE